MSVDSDGELAEADRQELIRNRHDWPIDFDGSAMLNRPGFTGDCLVLLKRLYLARSGLHSMPPLPQLV